MRFIIFITKEYWKNNSIKCERSISIKSIKGKGWESVEQALVRLLFESKWTGQDMTERDEKWDYQEEIVFENLVETPFMNGIRELVITCEIINDKKVYLIQ